MKHIIAILFLMMLCISCAELEEANQELCIPVSCGEILNGKVNLALYNDSGVDFDLFYYDISGYKDSVGFFPLQQYTCWINLDTLKTEYFIARGISEDVLYESDTLWTEPNNRRFNSGVFVLEIYTDDASQQLQLQFVEDYTGECKNI